MCATPRQTMDSLTATRPLKESEASKAGQANRSPIVKCCETATPGAWRKTKMKPTKPKRIVHRIHLGVDDDYLLGIISAKLGLVEKSLKEYKLLRASNADRLELFNLGVSRADRFTLGDLSADLREIRHAGPESFDHIVRQRAGYATMLAIRELCAEPERPHTAAQFTLEAILTATV